MLKANRGRVYKSAQSQLWGTLGMEADRLRMRMRLLQSGRLRAWGFAEGVTLGHSGGFPARPRCSCLSHQAPFGGTEHPVQG